MPIDVLKRILSDLGMRPLLSVLLLLQLVLLSGFYTVEAWAVTKVPPGNRSEVQPKIPSVSKTRTQATQPHAASHLKDATTGSGFSWKFLSQRLQKGP